MKKIIALLIMAGIVLSVFSAGAMDSYPGQGTTVTVYQYNLETGSVLGERTVEVSAGTVVIDAGNAPDGYEAVESDKKIIFVDENGNASENPVFFAYRKTNQAPGYEEKAEPVQQYAEAGQTIRFGRYEQDGNGANGPEEIEWMVLDVQGDKCLLLSKLGLDSIPYHDVEVNVTWEGCSLRDWLNNSFLKTAFTAEEQSRIIPTAVDNSTAQGYWGTYSGGDTWDRIFLLSYLEAFRYLGVTEYYEDNLMSRVEPSVFALQRGAKTYEFRTSEGKAAGVWWLRSPGKKQTSAAEVYADGALTWCVVHDPKKFAGVCVRPALWYSLTGDTQPDPVPSGQVVYPYDWDTEFKPGNPVSQYNTDRYKRLGNVGDDNYSSTYEWLIYSSERGDDIPELTAYFNGDTVSSIGIRNGNLKNVNEYYKYSRASRFTVMIYDYYGKVDSVQINIPDIYTQDYQVFSLGKTYTGVRRIEFWLNEFNYDETNTTAGKYLLYIADIQFYN